ncbi:hypothetical protein DFQ27_007174 [Actinomortierella ambigua]|uniref:Uncharacterized protein n=1 Tax=Actinomortierella ambigua TaxID=1343610 RepID=A0A9P6PTP0_9FUNG|nr:hypothetical protein DFQ27_007174 [Actinomortierella ambigua]
MGFLSYAYFDETCQCYESKQTPEGWIVAAIGIIALFFMLIRFYKSIIKICIDSVHYAGSFRDTPPSSPRPQLDRIGSTLSEYSTRSSLCGTPPPGYYSSRDSMSSSIMAAMEAMSPLSSPSPLPPPPQPLPAHTRIKTTRERQRTSLADYTVSHTIPIDGSHFELISITRQRHPDEALSGPNITEIEAEEEEEEESLTRPIPVLRLPPPAHTHTFRTVGSDSYHDGSYSDGDPYVISSMAGYSSSRGVSA